MGASSSSSLGNGSVNHNLQVQNQNQINNLDRVETDDHDGFFQVKVPKKSNKSIKKKAKEDALRA